MDFAAHALDALEQEPTLEELLRGVAVAKVHAAIRTLVGSPLQVTNTAGDPLIADDMTDDACLQRAPLRVELDIIGYVESAAPAAQVHAAAAVLENILVSANRYRLASAMHVHTVQLDYDELQRKHTALLESEARYRELNHDLERRVAEQVKTLDAAQRQLYQTEKLASLGQLAAGMAHEINNPMGFVQSNLTTGLGYVRALTDFAAALRRGDAAEALRHQWQTDDIDFAVEDLGCLLQESLDGAARVVQIVASLRNFARIDESDVSTVDVNAIVRSVCDVVRTHAGRAEIRLDLDPLPIMRGRAAHLGQLLFNLLLNAAQAMPPHRAGTIEVATASDHGEISIAVRDDGGGIPADELPKVCDPFFTTKDVGKGTGLGLTVCCDIARAHGGHLAIESTAGVGTTVTVHLPVT